MRRRTHLATGGLAFLLSGWLLSSFRDLPPGVLLGGFFAALAGSVTPDSLEPARHGNHRGIAHSRRALRASALGLVLSLVPVILQPFIPGLPSTLLPAGFLLGYLLHLLADSLTPAGLPE